MGEIHLDCFFLLFSFFFSEGTFNSCFYSIPVNSIGTSETHVCMAPSPGFFKNHNHYLALSTHYLI